MSRSMRSARHGLAVEALADRQASPALRDGDRGPGPTHWRAARSVAAVRRSHRRSAAGAGSRCHPGAGREPRASSRAARSAVRARPPSSGRSRGARAARRPRRRHAGGSAAWSACVNPACTAADDDRRAVRCRRVPGARLRQLLLHRHAPHAEGRARGDVRDLHVLPAGRRHRRRRHAAAAGARRGAGGVARATSMRSMPAGRPARPASSQSRCRPSACSRPISSP